MNETKRVTPQNPPTDSDEQRQQSRDYGSSRPLTSIPPPLHREPPRYPRYPDHSNNFPPTRPSFNSRNQRHEQPNQNPPPPPRLLQPTRNDPPRFCRYCRTPGHDIHECRRRAINECSGNERSLPSSAEPRRKENNSTGHPTNRDISPRNERITIANTLPLKPPQLPVITIESADVKKPCVFMIDTGAEPNLIKESAINSPELINRNKKTNLLGITQRRTATLGSIEIEIFHKTYPFYVIPDNFPIAQQGILGSAFLRQGAIISYGDNSLTL